MKLKCLSTNADAGDTVKCHSCGGTLNDWKPDDDPWLEHAHWFPHCTFLIQVKGPEFVETVIRNYSDLLSVSMRFDTHVVNRIVMLVPFAILSLSHLVPRLRYFDRAMLMPWPLMPWLLTSRRYLLYRHDDVIKWKHFPRYWPFVRGTHRSPVNSPHKGQWSGALKFSLICARINGSVNNGEAGDSRRHRARYNVIVVGEWVLVEKQQCPWLLHDMEMLSASLAFCVGNPPVTRWFPWQKASSAELICLLCYQCKKAVGQLSNCRWFETPYHLYDITVKK